MSTREADTLGVLLLLLLVAIACVAMLMLDPEALCR